MWPSGLRIFEQIGGRLPVDILLGAQMDSRTQPRYEATAGFWVEN